MSLSKKFYKDLTVIHKTLFDFKKKYKLEDVSLCFEIENENNYNIKINDNIRQF